MNSFWNGKRRFIALLMFLAGVFVALRVPPVIPVIQLPGERYPAGYDLPLLGIRMTNTLAGGILAWIILILLVVYIARRRPKSSAEVPPGGFYNMFEALFEGLMGFVGNIAGGQHFRLIFNVFMTIFLIVLASNWLELVPGVDTIGFIEPHVKEEYNADTGEVEVVTTDGYEIYPSVVGYAVNGQCSWISPADEAAADEAAQMNAQAADEAADDAEAMAAHNDILAAREAEKQARRDSGCYSGVGPVPWLDDGDDHSGDGDEAHADEEHHGIPLHPHPASEEAKLVPWVVLPFIRVPSTDLNMTLALALIAFVMIQYIGFKALGISYLGKFFAFGTLLKSPLGAIDVVVGLLELIGDFAKILSFSFRLLGNIFAGSILLFVMSFLIPILPWPFFILEFFVGVIQALVFALLTAIFMSLATVGHHHDEDHAEAH